MQQWKLRVFIAVVMAVSLIPLALCLPLWMHLFRQKLAVWRRWLSIGGLGLATASSFVPPLWIITMEILSDNGEASGVLDLAIGAVLIGMAAAILAFLLLCFAKDRVRWIGLGACALTILLFIISFSVGSFSVGGLR
jgi:hypothetical protein